MLGFARARAAFGAAVFRRVSLERWLRYAPNLAVTAERVGGRECWVTGEVRVRFGRLCKDRRGHEARRRCAELQAKLFMVRRALGAGQVSC